MSIYKNGLCELCLKESDWLLLVPRYVSGTISVGYLCPDCREKLRKIREEMA